MSTNPTPTSPNADAAPVLPTGITVLDEHLDGGLRAGSIVALRADPASQSELLLSEFTHERETLYLTLQRSPAAVVDSLEHAGADVERTNVSAIGQSNPLDEAYVQIQALQSAANVVIDPANVIETIDYQRFSSFLNAVKAQLTTTGGVAFLHCLDGESPPASRGTTEYMADVVFTLETELHGDRIDNRLFVTKNRGGSALPEALKIELTDSVLIDTSREIA